MSNLTKFLIGLSVLVLMIFSFTGCERIDAGHVGVKVNLYGDGKGVDDVTEVTGWVFYNPISTKIVEFPTYVQHKEYKKTTDIDESFVVNSKDGSEFHVSPLLNYSVKREKVPYIFQKYRVTLEEIEAGFLKTAVYDAFRVVANSYTADELISNREVFEIKVRKNSAKAEAESNRLRQQTLTPLLLQQMWIEKWSGNVPTTMLGQGQNLMFGLNK